MSHSTISAELAQYARSLFAAEDAELIALVSAARAEGLPVDWQVSPEIAKLLHLLCRAVGARRVVEFGTLAGYSALWIARALPWDGSVISIESNPGFAAFAREYLAHTDAGPRVEVRVAVALDALPDLEREAPFDAVFLDADKEHYPQFLEWAARVLRPGGLLIADNVLHSGSWGGQTLLDDAADDPRVLAVREFNRRLAADPNFTALVLPVGDGVAAAIFHPRSTDPEK
jgi:predicted O-methyltransferase YrrM